MKSLIICKDYKVYMNVCKMYGFDPREVRFIEEHQDTLGLDPSTPIFFYLSAGWPSWLHGTIYDELRERFLNNWRLTEINQEARKWVK